MALSSAIEWEVRPAGAGSNGGFFKAGATGTDYSMQDASQWTASGLTSVAAGSAVTFNSAANAMIGNGCYISAVTNGTVGFYEIVGVIVGSTVQLDRNFCSLAALGLDLKIGGGLNTIQQAMNNCAEGNTIWVLSGSYPETVTLKDPSGSAVDGDVNELYGYLSTHGDVPKADNRPLITGASARTYCLDVNIISGWRIGNFRFTAAQSSGVGGAINSGARNIFFNCKSYSNGGHGFGPANPSVYIACEANNNSFDGFSQANYAGILLYCYSHDNAVHGMNYGGGVDAFVAFCCCDTNSNVGFEFAGGTQMYGINNTAFNNTGANYEPVRSLAGSSVAGVLINNSSQDGGNAFYRLSATYTDPFFLYNQYNGASNSNFAVREFGSVTGSAKFTNGAGGDFSLQSGSPCIDAGMNGTTYTSGLF